MPPFLYRCPNTGYKVQGFIAEDVSDDSEDYRALTCLACEQVHYVSPTTQAMVKSAASTSPREHPRKDDKGGDSGCNDYCVYDRHDITSRDDRIR
jgi:hypothetical protein